MWSASQHRKDVGARYAYDAIECIRDHPSASEALSERCELLLVDMKKRAAERGIKLRGRDSWPRHPSLGLSAPDYGED